MDRHGGCRTATKATGVERFVLAKTTLRFLALVSFFSFAYSYLLSFSSYNNIQLSTLIFSLFAHSMDRKFMFFICNGIVAFLVNNLNFSSSAGSIINAAEDGVDQTSDVPAASTLVQENVAPAEFGDIISSVVREEETKECGEKETLNHEPAKDELEEEEEEEEEETEQCGYQAVSEPAEDELEEELEEDKGEESTAIVEEVNDASVSTEELNHKCEEFIRKMKEEIRIEAQQQLVAV